MTSLVILYTVIAFLISLSVAFFQYYFKVKKAPKHHFILFGLRTVSIFLLLLLLIDPKLEIQQTENRKPRLAVLVDNSLSSSFFNEQANIINSLEKLKASKLSKKFDCNYFSFGNDIKVLDSLSFDETYTNIHKSIQTVNGLYKNDISAVVLLSDGNQTIGDDYEFITSKRAVYPIVFGDTTRYEDLKITQLNVNKYSYLNNQFPVEAFLYYDGNKAIKATYSIYKSGKKVFSKDINLSKVNNTATITANLTSEKEGIHYYTASITKLPTEKNTKNNSKSFSVEVIDEQAKVLLLTSILHPDLGTLKKAIESNQQRKVTIENINNFKGSFADYQFVIAYQPTVYFKTFFEERKSNFLVITGSKTDWNFLNSLSLGMKKSAINQAEDYTALFNSNYLTFLQKNIGFENFPPLKDKFGTISVQNHQTLLYQKLQGISTDEPLLATFENPKGKFGVVFGEGIWKWRATSYLNDSSFETFDGFIGNLVQYLSSTKKRNRLEIAIENLYLANQPISVSALYLDRNFKFDNRASLQLKIINSKTKEQQLFPFSLVANSYYVQVEGLVPGEYSYLISVEGETIQKKGTFKVADFQIEEQFTNANVNKLNALANKSGGELFFPSQIDTLVDDLYNDSRYYTIQKAVIKEQSLLHWKWLLIGIIGLLAVEWFLRKYYGKL